MDIQMARTRAILTERDREVLSSDEKGNRYYQVVSEVRARVRDNLTDDVEILEENHPQLLEELREVVCKDE